MDSKKRNTWGTEDTLALLTLLKKYKNLALLKGKRLRRNETFKSLEKDMLEQGYQWDAVQIQTKFKNLKGDYYRTRKYSSSNGVEPTSGSEWTCPFYSELEDLLGDGSSTGWSSVNGLGNSESSLPSDVLEVKVQELEYADEGPASPMPSSNTEATPPVTSSDENNFPAALAPGVASASTNIDSTTSSGASPRNISCKQSSFREHLTEVVGSEIKSSINSALQTILNKQEKRDERFLEKLLAGQERILRDCTSQFLKGLAEIFGSRKNINKRSRQRSSSSESSSDSEKCSNKKRK